MMKRGTFGQYLHNSFALSPFKILLCQLVCNANQSPVLSQQKQSMVYQYVIKVLTENGVVEKPFIQLRYELQTLDPQSLVNDENTFVQPQTQLKLSNQDSQGGKENPTQISSVQQKPNNTDLADLLDSSVSQLLQQPIDWMKPEASIDNLYQLLHSEVPKTNKQFATVKQHQQGLQDPSQKMYLLQGLIITFLRRCEIAFGQIMFEQLVQLKEQVTAYVRGEPYQYSQAPVLVEQWVDTKSKQMEQESLVKDFADQQAEITKATQHAKKAVNFHTKHLLTSLSYTQSLDPEPAVAELHKYFDYNMRSKITKQNEETGNQDFVGFAVKVHQPAINLAGVRFKLGQYDQALLSVVEAIKLSQNKNDHEGILQCLVWLHQILNTFGNKDQEMRILEHIIMQSQQRSNSYFFFLACLNYTLLPSAKSTSCSQKISEVLKQIQLNSTGPVWNDLINACNLKVHLMYEQNNTKDFITQLKPLIFVRTSQVWNSVGSKLLGRNTLINCFQMFGRNAFKLNEVLSTLYSYAITLANHSLTQAFDLIELLLQFGRNPLAVDFYFAFLVVAHTASLNRFEFQRSMLYERLLEKLVGIKKQNVQVAQMWLSKCRRLYAQDKLEQLQDSLNRYLSFCSQYGFLQLRFEGELLQIDLQIKVGEVGQALVNVSQLSASLQQHKNNYGAIKLKVQVKVAELKLLIGETGDAFVILTQDVLSQVIQNGSRKLQMQVYFQLARVSLEFSKLKPSSEADFSLFKRKLYLQSLNYLKEAITIAVDLNHLETLRDSFYLMAMTCAQLIQENQQLEPQAVQTLHHKKEQAAQLFLESRKLISQSVGSMSVYQTQQQNLNINSLLQGQKEQTNQIIRLFQEPVRDLKSSSMPVQQPKPRFTATQPPSKQSQFKKVTPVRTAPRA